MSKRRMTHGVLLLCLAAIAAYGQETLPPATQQAFDRGVAAAAQKQWDIAIRNFSQAQGQVRTSPQILFNLGLAHDKAGHELAAIAWFRAYLAAEPNSSNSETVRKEIARLDVATESKANTLVKLALETAQKLPGPDKAEVLSHTADAYASVLDVQSALPFVTSRNPKQEFYVWRLYGTALGKSGDFAGAEAAANRMTGAMVGLTKGEVGYSDKCGKANAPAECNQPADADEQWNDLWMNVFQFYFGEEWDDLPLNDYATCGMIAAKFRIPSVMDFATKGHKRDLEEAIAKPDGAKPPVERWIVFAEKLSGKDIVVNLDAAIAPSPDQSNPLTIALYAQSAPSELMDDLYKVRALDRMLTRQAQPPPKSLNRD